MSIKIDLYVDDKKYKVLDFHFGFFQDSDYTGLPVAKTNAYPFQFTLEATKDITFFEWAAHSTMQKRQVKIVFSPISGMGKSTVIELLDVNCLRCDFCYRSTGKAPALEHIDLHPATIIRDGRVLLQRHWAVTDPAMLKMTPVQRITEDTTPKITAQYITDLEGIERATYERGAKIYCVIKSQNFENETVTIDMSKFDVPLLYQGKKLEDNRIENYTISTSEEKIPLQVIPEDYEDEQ